MKKLLIFALVVMAGVAMADPLPNPAQNIANSKLINCYVATLGAADGTYPIWVAPCYGKILMTPRFSSAVGSTAADTSTTQNWAIYFYARDSAATAASDTIAYYTTLSASGAYSTTALKSYKMTWLSAATSRTVHKGDVISIRSEETGTCTAITDIAVSFIFYPLTKWTAWYD